MRLALFIEREKNAIIQDAIAFARTLAVFSESEEAVLRNHFPQVLQAIADDMRTDQTERASIIKSHSEAAVDPKSDAVFHGRQRALDGLQIDQVIAEYRALRSSVLRLWQADSPEENRFPSDIGRFNEAIDQAIAESVGAFAKELEGRRQIFLAAVGHDLRGPLQAVTLSARAIANKSSQTLNKYTDILTRSAQRMATLLESLLDYNLIGLGGILRVNRRQVDLIAECEEEVLILEAALPEITIEQRFHGDCVGAYDASRIGEALSNLVTNAAKYGVSAQPVQVCVSGSADAVTISVANAVEKQILDADLKLLFDPLRRGSHPEHSAGRASLGLGLFITKEIVEAHGGTATASCTAELITFTLTLPKT